jgi:hypothetical protein
MYMFDFPFRELVLRFWRALPMLGKITLLVCLTVFYLYGNRKMLVKICHH